MLRACRENQLGSVASPIDLGVALVSGSTEHASEDALSALVNLVEADLEACNRIIVARMDSPVALIPQLAAHIVAAGGKRLRPLLTLAAARLCGYPGRAGGARHVALAACVEFIHTATLLHDDVVDESALRRGLASANAVFGNQASVLVGDFLFARAFQLMVEDGSLKVLAILSRAAATIAEGEVLQLVTQNDLSTQEARYLEVDQGQDRRAVRRRLPGRRRGGRPPGTRGSRAGRVRHEPRHRLPAGRRRAGLRGRPGDAGQDGRRRFPRGQDHPAGPGRLPGRGRHGTSLLAADHRGAEQTDADLDHAMRLMAEHGAIRVTLDSAQRFVQEAKAALTVFPDSPIRQALADVADYTVQRLR